MTDKSVREACVDIPMDTLKSSERKAARAIVYGRVQGVGFRYWTVQVARAFGITGWVRNRPDYSVEIFAEGTGAALYDFFTAVEHEHPRAFISQFTVTAAAYEGLHSFQVRY